MTSTLRHVRLRSEAVTHKHDHAFDRVGNRFPHLVGNEINDWMRPASNLETSRDEGALHHWTPYALFTSMTSSAGMSRKGMRAPSPSTKEQKKDNKKVLKALIVIGRDVCCCDYEVAAALQN